MAEMFCDRLAASKVYRGKDFNPGDPYQFYLRGKDRRLLIHPATAALLETMLLKLRDEGEDAAFAYIRAGDPGKSPRMPHRRTPALLTGAQIVPLTDAEKSRMPASKH